MTDPTAPGPTDATRRALLWGGAWSVPAIVAMAATPLASASATSLAFDRSSYGATGCQTVSSVTVRATDGTGPAAGVTVSVTLPSGYVFSTGATTFSGSTDGSGVVSLPGIVTPARGGGVSLTAVTTGATATSLLQVASKPGTGYTARLAQITATFPTVPAEATSVGAGYYLAPNGRLFFGDTQVATGVTAAAGWFYFDGSAAQQYVDYTLTAGGAGRLSNGNVSSLVSWPSVPATAVPVCQDYFLSTNGDLYYQNSRIAGGIASAVGLFSTWTGNNDFFGTYVRSGGGVGRLSGATATAMSWAAIPATARPVGVDYFLAGNGDLFYQNTVVATGVTSARAYFTWKGGGYTTLVDYVLRSGGARQAERGSAPSTSWDAVPAGSVAVGTSYFLSPRGDLFSAGSVVASSVTSARGWLSYGASGIQTEGAFVVPSSC